MPKSKPAIDINIEDLFKAGRVNSKMLLDLDHHIRTGKKLPPELQRFGARHFNNWPKKPNRWTARNSSTSRGTR